MDINSVLHIINALRGEQGNDVLLQAEQHFAKIQSQPGLSQVLIHILQSSAQYDHTIRLTASILLKKIIQNNWSHEEVAITEEDDAKLSQLQELSQQHVQYAQEMALLTQQQQELPEVDKQFVKQHLPTLLGDPSSPLRNNIAMCIALVGTHDFPDKWPELRPGLIHAIQQTDNINIVQGGLLCFNILLTEVIDTTLRDMVPELFPVLVSILTARFTSDEIQEKRLQLGAAGVLQSEYRYPALIRTQALDLYGSFLKCFTLLEDPGEPKFETHFRALIKPNIKDIVHICLETIIAPLPTATPQVLPQSTTPVSNNFDQLIYVYSLPAIVHQYNLSTPQHLELLAEAFQFETRGSAMKVLGRLCSFFPKTLKDAIDVQNVVLDNTAQGLQQTIPYYLANIITPLSKIRNIMSKPVQQGGVPDIFKVFQILPQQYFSESNISSPLFGLPYYLNCVITFLDAMTDHVKVFPKFVMNKLDKFLPQFAYLTMLTAQDVETYQYDVNAFTLAEGDIDHEKQQNYNDDNLAGGVSLEEGNNNGGDTEVSSVVRHEALRFITIALGKWSIKGAVLISQTLMQLWTAGEQMKANFVQYQQNPTNPIQCVNNFVWWQYQEAALLAVGKLLCAEKGYHLEQIQAMLPIQNVVQIFIQQSLTATCSPGNEAEEDIVYLQSRGMWLIGHTIRYLTSQLTTNLHKTQNFAAAQQVYANLQFLVNLLPQGFGDETPLPTRITTAHTISNLNMVFLAMDHSFLMHQLQQASDQFYAQPQNAQLKQEFDYCMAHKQPVPLHHELVNTVPFQGNYESIFAKYLPTFIKGFCTLLNDGEVTDEGIEPIVQAICWIFSFLSNWDSYLTDLGDQFPYLQLFAPKVDNVTKQQPLPQFAPHLAALSPELIQQIFRTTLNVWFDNCNDNNLSEQMVDLFHIVAALNNIDLIKVVAATCYEPLLIFVTTERNVFSQRQTATNKISAISKMAMMGPISILLRALSPGPFTALTSKNALVDPTTTIPGPHEQYKIYTLEQLANNATVKNFAPTALTTTIPVGEVIHKLLPGILQLGVQSTEKVFAYACVALSSTILAVYHQELLAQMSKDALIALLQQAKTLALLLIKPFHPIDPQNPQVNQQLNSKRYTNQLGDVDDEDMRVACRMIVQLLVTYQSVLPQEWWFELLNIVITKLATTDNYKLIHRCVYILARVGVHHTQALVQYLATQCGMMIIPRVVKKGETKRSQKTGKLITTKDEIEYLQQHTFQRVINIILQTAPTLYSTYLKTVITTFLVLMINDDTCRQLLQQLTVDDELIVETSRAKSTIFQEKRKTRAQGIVIEKYTQCNAVSKVLKLLCKMGFDEMTVAQRLMDAANAPIPTGDLAFLNNADDDSDGENENAVLGNGADSDDDDDMSATKDLFGDYADGVKNGTLTLDQLLDMDLDGEEDGAGGAGLDIEGDKEEFPECVYDRLLGVELSTLIATYIAKEQHNPQSAFVQHASELNGAPQTQFTALVNFAQIAQQKLKK